MYIFSSSHVRLSSAKQLTEPLTILVLLACSIELALNIPVCNAQSSRNPSVTNQSEDFAVPATNSPYPPELPSRRVPAPPVVQSGFSNAASTKSSLAWRHKAMKMSQDKFKSSGPDNASNTLLRGFSASYSDTLMALANSCSIAGFTAEQINSNAGEILAINRDSNARIVFSVWEQTDGKTWISAGSDRGNSATNNKNAILILDTTGNTIGKRGRI